MPNKYNREKVKIGQTWEEGEGEREEWRVKSARRKRRVESSRGRVHLTSGRAASNTPASLAARTTTQAGTMH